MVALVFRGPLVSLRRGGVVKSKLMICSSSGRLEVCPIQRSLLWTRCPRILIGQLMQPSSLKTWNVFPLQFADRPISFSRYFTPRSETGLQAWKDRACEVDPAPDPISAQVILRWTSSRGTQIDYKHDGLALHIKKGVRTSPWSLMHWFAYDQQWHGGFLPQVGFATTVSLV